MSHIHGFNTVSMGLSFLFAIFPANYFGLQNCGCGWWEKQLVDFPLHFISLLGCRLSVCVFLGGRGGVF